MKRIIKKLECIFINSNHSTFEKKYSCDDMVMFQFLFIK